MEKSGVVAKMITSRKEMIPRGASLERSSHGPDTSLDGAQPEPEYLTIAEAANLLDVQTRSVYCYLEDGSLTSVRLGRATMLRREEVLGFQRRAPGRTRINTPSWHVPPMQNLPYLIMITVHIRSGQGEKLEHHLRAMRDTRAHWLPGTTARYIARDQQQPEVVQIVFIWRGAAMPPEEEQQAALAAFQADLADVLEWETASWKHACVLLHA